MRWEAPPPKRLRGGKGRSPGPMPVWRALLEPVMERPGQWARIRDFDRPKAAWNARQNLTASHRGNRPITSRHDIPEGRWEFTSRSFDDGTSALYARYLGGDA